MVYTFYDASVGMAKGAIKSLSLILDEAEKHPNSATFFTARLSEDMKPLTFQIHYATFQAQQLAEKLSGREFNEPEEDVDSYEKMRSRIQKALDCLDKTDKDTVNKLAETITTVDHHGTMINVPLKGLLGLVNMPNVYFHISMAYAILRKEGVPLGKRNWSRGFVAEYL